MDNRFFKVFKQFSALTFLSMVLVGCLKTEHDIADPGGDTAPTLVEKQKGEELYSETCAGCHGGIDNHNISNLKFSHFINTLTSIPAMKSNSVLQELKREDLILIQRALKFRAGGGVPAPQIPGGPITPAGPPDVALGQQLYNQRCTGCHLQLDISTVRGKSILALDWALLNISSMRSFALSEQQKVNVIAALGGNYTRPTTPMPDPDPTPTTDPDPLPESPNPPELVGDPISGAQIYTSGNLCVNCHGAFATSNKRNMTLERFNWAVANVPSMSSRTAITGLSAQSRVDLVAALSETMTPMPDPDPNPGPTPDPNPTPIVGNAANGRFIYNQNNLCVNCHMSVSSTNKRGSTLTQLNWAIGNIPAMASSGTINTLTAQERADLIAALNEPVPPGESGGDNSEIQISSSLPLHGRLYTFEFFGKNYIGDIFDVDRGSYVEITHRAVNNIIGATLKPTGNVFGGACTSYHKPCSSAESDEFREHANYSVLRKGYINSTCERVLVADYPVRSTLIYNLGSDVSATIPARANVETLAQAYLMGRETTEIVDSLMSVAAASRAASQSTLDQWRMIVITLCKSPLGEAQ